MESSSDTIPLIYDLSFSTTNVENVLLILGSVEIFKEYTNSNGFPIVHQPIHKRTDILDVLQTRFTQIKRLCIIDHFTEDPDFLEEESLFHESNVQFLVQLIQTFQITNIDFLACNTLRSDSWKAFYKTLQEQANVIVGASDDNTGNIKHGGDWVLETTMENVKQIYFNEKVDQYSELLSTVDIITDWGDGTSTTIRYSSFNSTNYTVNAYQFISGVLKMPETIVYSSNTYTIVSLGTNSTSGTWSPDIIPTLTANVTSFNRFVFRTRGGTFDLRHLYNLRSLPNQFSHAGRGPLYLPYGLSSIANDGFNMHNKDIANFTIPDTLTNMASNSLWHGSQSTGDLQELIMFDRFGNHYRRNTLPSGLLYSSTYNYDTNTTDSLNAMIFNFSTQKNDTSLWTPIVSSTPLPTAGIVGLTSDANHYNLNGTLSQTTFSDLYFNDISMATTNKNLSIDTTHTITMTYEDSKVNVYIDGTKEVTDATGASTYDSIVLNRGPDAADNGATGVYDDLKIFNRVLNQTDINDLNNIYVLYNVTVSNEVLYIQNNNTITEKPELVFTENRTYIFDQSDPTNTGNTLVLGTLPDSSTNLIDYQTIVGTPGQPGAYTTFTASGETVYYYSFETPDMGYVPLIPIYHITMNAVDVTYGGSIVNNGSSSQGTFTCNQPNDTNITFDNDYLEIKVETNFTGITMSNLNVPNNYTISFWFNASTNGRTFVIGYKTSTGYSRIEWWSNRWAPGGDFTKSGGNDYYSVCGSGHSSNLIYSDYGYNKWHFICFVISGDNVHLYENGLDTNSSTTLTTSSTPNGDEFIIAYGPSYPVSAYNGIDDFKIYDWALSSEQITTIYDSYTLPYSP